MGIYERGDEHHRLFVRSITLSETQQLTVALHSMNTVRPHKRGTRDLLVTAQSTECILSQKGIILSFLPKMGKK